MRQSLTHLDGGRFLLTEPEFRLIKEQYKNLRKEITALLGPDFAEESLKFSEPISDHREILQAMMKCAALLATEK